MGMPALKLEFEEDTVEDRDRLTKFQSDVEHLQSDVSEIKGDIRLLHGKIDTVDKSLSAKIEAVDQRLSAKLDGVDQRLTGKIDSLRDSMITKFDAVNATIAAQTAASEKFHMKLILWAITIFVSGMTGLLTTMAHGFHWL
jgi:chromosome segregation ATPase